MKKPIRILSLIMAIVMLSSVFGVAGSAYAPFKGTDIAGDYDDADSPTFSLNQYASMALDELDRMLAKEKIFLDIYIGQLDLASVDTTFESLKSLFESITPLLGTLGDASILKTAFERAVYKNGVSGEMFKRNKTVANAPQNDLDVCYALLNFISGLAPLLEKYGNGTVTLGIMNSFIADYIFDIRELAAGVLFGLTPTAADMTPPYNYFEEDAPALSRFPDKYKSGNALKGDAVRLVIQNLANDFLLGRWVKLDDYFDRSANVTVPYPKPATAKYTVVNYNFYPFAEKYDETSPDTAAYDYYGYVHPDDWVTVALGDCVRVAEGAAAPGGPQDGGVIEFYSDAAGWSAKTVYNFCEDAMRRAYNYIAVPVLNRDTRPWLREQCGVEYDHAKTYKTTFQPGTGDTPGAWVDNPTYTPAPMYAGEPGTYDGDLPANFYEGGGTGVENINRVDYPLAYLFDIDAFVQKVDCPPQVNLINYLNTGLGDFVSNILNFKLPGEAGSRRGVVTSAPAVSFDGLVNNATWSWDYGNEDANDSVNNAKLFKNIVSVGKFVLQVVGPYFFGDVYLSQGSSGADLLGREKFPTAEAIGAMDDQKAVAFVVRSIFNAFVDWMYIEPSYTENGVEYTNDTLAAVLYRACEQLAWKDVPGRTYVRPSLNKNSPEYNSTMLEKTINILFDVLVYNLNQGFDMFPNKNKSAASPKTGEGLLSYLGEGETYRRLLAQLADWAIGEYGDLLALDLNFKHVETADDGTINKIGATTNPDETRLETCFWDDVDTIVNALVPIKGENSWLNGAVSSKAQVIKALLFDFFLEPVYKLDSTELAKIFLRKNDGEIANKTVEGLAIALINRVLDAVLPGVFKERADLDSLLASENIGGMLGDLARVLGTKPATGAGGVTLTPRGEPIFKVALPILCDLLGLTGNQRFREMQIYIPEHASAGDLKDFQIVNGSDGINTGWTNSNGNFSQDSLYKYKIKSVSVETFMKDPATSIISSDNSARFNVTGVSANDVIEGGNMLNARFAAAAGQGLAPGEEALLKLKISYYILGEDGDSMLKDNNGDVAIDKTVYCYVSDSDKDDDAIDSTITAGDREIKYYPAVYLSQGRELSKLEEYNIRIKDVTQENTQATASATAASVASTEYPFLKLNGDASKTSAAMNGQGGTYFLNPFEVNEKSAGVLYERLADNYLKDSEGALILDDQGKPRIDPAQPDNGGVPNGKYVASATINVAGATNVVSTDVFLYDDFGLPGLFRNCVDSNRQKSDYDTETSEGAANLKFTAYEKALRDAAGLVLMPKRRGSFESAVATTATHGTPAVAYENKYEELYDKLDTAIKELDEYKKSAGLGGLTDKLAEFSPRDFDVKSYNYGASDHDYKYKDYWEYDHKNAANAYDYPYFGSADYVSKDYKRYKEARNRAEDLIDSQELSTAPAPLKPDKAYTQGETDAYNAAIEAYNLAYDKKGVVGAVEAAYAEHMVALTGARLIRVDGNKSRLNDVIANYGSFSNFESSPYSAPSKEAYLAAKDFANYVNGLQGDALRQTAINMAAEKLVYTWKRLAVLADYDNLDGALAASRNLFGGNTPALPSAQTQYTADSYDAFYDAYLAAERFDRNLISNPTNQRRIDKAASKLNAARAALESATVAPNVTLKTEQQSLYPDPNWTYYFIPQFIDETFFSLGFSAQTLVDQPEICVSNYIIGYGFPGGGEESVLPMFDGAETADIVVEPSATGIYGTGTAVKIYPKNADQTTTLPAAVYQIVVFGDPDMDEMISGGDADLCDNYANGLLDDWLYGTSTDFYRYAAMDVDGDYAVTTADVDQISNASSGLITINQQDPAGGEATLPS